MKKILITTTTALLLTAQAAFAQPAIDWQKIFEGDSTEANSIFNDVISTSDGGYMAIGYGKSSGGDLPNGYIDNGDVLIVKMDATGAVQWSKYWGDQETEYAYSVIQTSDSGFVIAGKTNSAVDSMNHGEYDGFVIKLDASGALQWKKLYGGSEDDNISCIRQNPDGTLIFVGSTRSPETEGFNGYEDVWIVKLDNNGTVLWEKSKGYLSFDQAYTVELTADGGYIVACYTSSSSATNSHGGSDIWILKINSVGAISWQQCIGGSGADYGAKAIEANDGSIMVIGESESNDGDAIGSHGNHDVSYLRN